MNRTASTVVGGGLLIAAGVLLLLQNFGLVPLGEYIWAGVLGLGALLFLYVFAADRGHWWALIPGISLLAIALMLVLVRTTPRWAALYGGGLVLGGIGLSFLAVMLARRENWWALIPGGVLLTLGGVVTLEQYAEVHEMQMVDTGGVFFLGLGLTFLLVYLIPTPHGRMKWAVWPSIPLLLLGALALVSSARLWGMLGPALVILGGLVLVYRALRPPAPRSGGRAV